MTRGADRVRLDRVTPDSYLALHAFAVSVDKASAAAGLEPGLLELVRVRASQLNGCGFCLDMHTKQAKAAGETDQRLHTLP
ncbi:MAG: carboxymuconolactone decarboxylase family protein, partial [Sciscionella sp.]